MDDLHRQVVVRIRALARKRRWSANQLADFAGLGRGFVSEVLAGKKSPTLRTLAKLAAALDVPVRELMPEA
jgi:transcriptional regulator with XRE-family HTH domain